MTHIPSFGDPTPFADLPAALVEEILEQTNEVTKKLLASFTEVKERRERFRSDLCNAEIITPESSLGSPPPPTTCAADGSYAVERLLSTDLAAAAAVAVEGLAPPSETRHWESPYHKSYIVAEPHNEDTATILRAVMLGEELRLITEAPHDLLMLDGTLTLPTIYFNQAISKASDNPELECSQKFIDNCCTYLEAYLTILHSKRSDKQYIGLPKYTTKREIGSEMQWPSYYDDRGMLTLLLNPTELTKPRTLEHPRDTEGNLTWHINTQMLPSEVSSTASKLVDKIVSALASIKVCYYKPQNWLPALRIEAPSSIMSNKHRLAIVIQGIKNQTAIPSMLEPYPIYLADRMAKALARAIPAFRQVTTQSISESYQGNIEEVYFAMHGYRSESGR